MSRLTIVAALAALGCAEEVAPPTPPDLSALVRQYEQPSGTVTAETARQLVEQAATTLGLISNPDALFTLASDLFDAFADRKPVSRTAAVEAGLAQQAQAVTVGGVAVDAGAWMIYRRACPRANGNGALGALEMTALTDLDAGFRPVIWGRAVDCRFIEADAEAGAAGSRIDGAIALHIDWTDDGVGRVILRVDGALTLAGTLLEGIISLSWQTVEAGTEILTHFTLADGGGFLVGSLNDRLVIEGANGRFLCDASGCDGPGGRFEW